MVDPITNKYKWIPNEEISEWEAKGWEIGGNKHSEETKKKLSEIKTGQKMKEETKQKISNTLSGREVSNESRKKISESLSNRIRISKGDNLLYIKEEFLEEYKEKGWMEGVNKTKGKNNPSYQNSLIKTLKVAKEILPLLSDTDCLDRDIQNRIKEEGVSLTLETAIKRLVDEELIEVIDIVYKKSGRRDKKTCINLI